MTTKLALQTGEELNRPRLHSESSWDPSYIPLVIQHENATVTFDRWFWRILDDGGLTTVEIDGEVVLHGPSESIVFHNAEVGFFGLNDSDSGEVVLTFPSKLFDAAILEAGGELSNNPSYSISL